MTFYPPSQFTVHTILERSRSYVHKATYTTKRAANVRFAHATTVAETVMAWVTDDATGEVLKGWDKEEAS